MLPVISHSVRDARAQLHTGHQDIRTYFSQATVVTTAQTTRSGHRRSIPVTPRWFHQASVLTPVTAPSREPVTTAARPVITAAIVVFSVH
jgi:hypothetical protein